MRNGPSQRHILAINNSEKVLDVFRLLLEEEGYRVSTSLYLFKDMTDIRAMRPDLIILDYMWPEDDGGWSLLQMLKMDRVTGRIPIVLCTGAKKEVEQLGDHLTQMDVAVVLKPFNIDTLLDIIAKRLDGRSSGGGAEGRSDVRARETEPGDGKPPIRAIN